MTETSELFSNKTFLLRETGEEVVWKSACLNNTCKLKCATLTVNYTIRGRLLPESDPIVVTPVVYLGWSPKFFFKSFASENHALLNYSVSRRRIM